MNTVRDLREVLKPIYFWMNVMKWGAIAIAAFLVLAAVLQVGNTIRLAAFARRREIGIMRLVGASSLYIQLPFLMEALVAALVGVALAAGALVLFMYVVIYRHAETELEHRRVDRLGRRRAGAIGWIALIGLALTLIPTLVTDPQIPQSLTLRALPSSRLVPRQHEGRPVVRNFPVHCPSRALAAAAGGRLRARLGVAATPAAPRRRPQAQEAPGPAARSTAPSPTWTSPARSCAPRPRPLQAAQAAAGRARRLDLAKTRGAARRRARRSTSRCRPSCGGRGGPAAASARADLAAGRQKIADQERTARPDRHPELPARRPAR